MIANFSPGIKILSQLGDSGKNQASKDDSGPTLGRSQYVTILVATTFEVSVLTRAVGLDSSRRLST